MTFCFSLRVITLIYLVFLPNCVYTNPNDSKSTQPGSQNGFTTTVKPLPVIMGDQVTIKHKMNSILFIVAIFLMMLMSFLSHLLKVNNIHFVPESAVCLLIGIIVGAIFREIPANDINYGNCTALDHPSQSGNVVPDFIIVKTKKQNIHTFYELSGSSSDPVTLSLWSYKVEFNPEIFFYFILAPIMFCAGFKANKQYYFKNFGFIILLSVFGTLITSIIFSVFVYGLSNTFELPLNGKSFQFSESLLFASLISPTDPVSVLSLFKALGVDPDLYSFVFGECSLNDAISLVLYSTMEHHVNLSNMPEYIFNFHTILKFSFDFFCCFFGSALIGIAVAIVTSMFTKLVNFDSNHVLEMALFLFLSYLSFLLAEVNQLTGVVSVFFCGIFQTHYGIQNLSQHSRTSVESIFYLWTYMAENFSFAYMGITFMLPQYKWDLRFMIIGIFGILIARTVTVYCLSFFANLARREKIPMSFQHIMILSGMKGAFSFALAAQNVSSVSRELILTSTIGIILFSVIFCGSLLYPAILYLKIPIFVKTTPTDVYHQNENDAYTDVNVGSKYFSWWRRLDDKYIFPFLTIYGPSFSSYLPSFCRAPFEKLGQFLGHGRESNQPSDDEEKPFFFENLVDDAA